MSGRVKGEGLVQPGHPTQQTQLFVDVRVVLQVEKVIQAIRIPLQDGQPLTAEQYEQGEADFGLRLHGAVDQPLLFSDIDEIVRRQGGEVRIAQSCITAEQECIQRLLQAGMPPMQTELLQTRQFIQRQMRMPIGCCFYLIVAERMALRVEVVLPDGGIYLLLQVFQVLGHRIGVQILPPQEQLKVRNKLKRQVGKQNLRAKSTQLPQGGAEIAPRTFLDGSIPHLVLHEAYKRLPARLLAKGFFQ